MRHRFHKSARRLVVAFIVFALVFGLAPCAPAQAAEDVGESSGVVTAGADDATDSDSTGTMSAQAAKSKTVRILCVGNSWTTRSVEYLSSIAESAGKKVIIGHAFLKRSSLQEQYFGLLNGGGVCRYNGELKQVRTGYTYHKYDGSDDYTKKSGVSLSYAIQDEPWDYLVLQNRAPESGNYGTWDKQEARNEDVLYKYDSDGSMTSVHFDINDFVDLIKAQMKPSVARKLKVGLSAVWSYPKGQEGGVADSIDEYLQAKGLKTPSTQAQWNAVYTRLYHDIQTTIPKVAEHMGSRCDFIVNPGKAFAYARKNAELSRFGYHLSTSRTNAHPAAGIPCYIAGLTYAFGILGISWDDLKGYQHASTKSYRVNAQGNLVGYTLAPSSQVALRAVACAWQAQKGAKVRVGRFSATPLFGREDVAGKRRSPSLKVRGPNFGTLERGVDFKVVKRKVNARKNRLRITYRGIGRYRGKVTRSFKLRPGKVKLRSARGELDAVHVTWKAPGSAKATGVQIRFVAPKTGRVVRSATVGSCTSSAKTFTGIKGGKRYKVQVRAYRVVKGKRYAGAWSAARAVRVAKAR